MVYCNSCGASNDDNASFCNLCGATLTERSLHTGQSELQPYNANNASLQQTYYPEDHQYFYSSENYVNPQGSAVKDKKLKTRRKSVIASIIFLILVVGTIVTYFTLQNLVYSPEATVKNYLNLVSQGKYTQAMSEYTDFDAGHRGLAYVNPHESLFTDKFAGDANSRISNAKVLSSIPYECIAGKYYKYVNMGNAKKSTCYKVKVNYNVGDKNVNRTLYVRYDSTQLFIFKKYRIGVLSTATSILVKVPSNKQKIKINGKEVELYGCYDNGTSAFDVIFGLPGIYKITAYDKYGKPKDFVINTANVRPEHSIDVDTVGSDDY